MSPAGRRTRPVVVLAVCGWAVAVIGGVGGLTLRVVDPAPILPNTYGIGEVSLIAMALLGMTWASIGAFLVIRRPDNDVGRAMVLVGVGIAASVLTAASTFAAAAHASAGSVGTAAVWGWLTVVSVMSLGFIPYVGLIFPTRRGQTSRWDRVARFYLVFLAAFAALLFFHPGDLHVMPGIRNPFGFGPDLRPMLGGQLSALFVIGLGAWAPLLGLSVTSRYRASGLTERQQLKWFILATALTLGGLIALGMEAYITGGRSSETGVVLFGLTGMTIPIAIGIAILRYRLYEIDRLVSRTLAYAVLSAVLVGVYVAGFVGIQAGLASFTTSGGPIAVAASTLVVFALFQPLRRRLQRAMDRRFNRSRYDAQRTVDAFAARLRDEVDLDRLGAELRSVVGVSLAPATLGVWLRGQAQ